MADHLPAPVAPPPPVAAPAAVTGAPRPGRVLPVLLAAGVVGGLGISAAGAAGALLMAEVTGDDALAGLPQTGVVLGAGGAALVVSAATRRFGRGPALALGALTAVPGGLAAAAGGFLGSAAAIVLGSVLIGAGQAALMLTRYAAADLAAPDRRGRTMAAVLLATTVGTVLGPNLMPAVGAMAVAVGWPELSGPYLLAAATSALAAATLAVGLRGPGTGEPTGAPPVPPSAAPVVGPAAEPAAGPPVRAAASSRAGAWRAALGRRGAVGIATLAVANLVMVAVMTMAPVHLEAAGVTLGGIGLVISLHIAAMFAPSPLSGWLADRWGPAPVAVASAVVLTVASGLAAVAGEAHTLLTVGLVLLGLGWNLGLVGGSVLLTTPAPGEATAVALGDRARREGWGEAAMGAAAAVGGAASGLVMSQWGYPALAAAGAVAAVVIGVAVVLGRDVVRLSPRPSLPPAG